MLKQCFPGKRVTVDILRSAYIINFYNDARHSLKEKDEVARLMRHSSRIAEREYNKIDLSKVTHPDNLVVASNMMSVKEIPPPIVQDKTYFDLKDWRKKYRDERKEVINKKAREHYKENKDKILRNHILFNLNKSCNTAVPKQVSINKYGLVYDENLKRWI